MKTKKCSKCGKVLPVSSFHIKSSSLDKRQNYCKNCARLMRKEYKKIFEKHTSIEQYAKSFDFVTDEYDLLVQVLKEAAKWGRK